MGNEIQTPQTKEFVVTAIHDAALFAQIKEMINGMQAGLLETNLDDEYFFVALFGDALIRFIDLKTFQHVEVEIQDHLASNKDTACFVVVDADKPLSFQYPRLRRLQDVSLEWIANEIAKGREWDEQECERYRREVRNHNE